MFRLVPGSPTQKFILPHCFTSNLSPKKRIVQQTRRLRSFPTYDLQEGVEILENYCNDGFYPIKLDDSFLDGRYSIVHKLGYGTFSTVWLARDHGKNRYVSLKIPTANASGSRTESEMRRRLSEGDSRHPGYQSVQFFLDEFEITGPNGQHHCLVSEIVGHNFHEVKDASEHELLPMHIAKRAKARLSLGLAYIHSCGLIHGDLHPKNIAFALPDFNHWTVNEIHDQFGEPDKWPVRRFNGEPIGPEAPPYTVISAYFWRLGMENITKEVRIIDFGEASSISEPRTKLHIPMSFCAPPALFDEDVTRLADVWAFACTVFELFGSSSLFEVYGADKDGLLAEITKTLGPLPKSWDQKWHYKNLCLKDRDDESTTDSLESRVHAIQAYRRENLGDDVENLSTEDLNGLYELLSACLRYSPSDSPTMKEVLKLPWMRKLLQEEGLSTPE